MDLTSWLLRVAARSPHVLVVAVPGNAPARLALEAALARRGWPSATAPADADILAVAGSAGPELAAVVDRIWQLVPAPRARVAVVEPAAVDGELDRAAAELRDRDHQRREPSAGLDPPGDASTPAHGDHEDRAEHRAAGDADGGEHHGSPEAGGGPGAHAEHGGDHGGHEGHGGHGGHGGHHGHGGGMEMPGGLPMADLGEDRDGLTLDQLHVPLGPVLPEWPAGLVVRVTLQGDVIQEATAEVLDAGHARPIRWPSGNGVARELDGLARFLGVAGWADAAASARGLRDALLAGGATEQPAPVAGLVRRVRRSRTLRWLIRGVPAGTSDVAGLLEARLGAIEAMLTVPDAPAVPRPGVEELPELLVGAELAAARLIVAAVDPETDRSPVAQEARHG